LQVPPADWRSSRTRPGAQPDLLRGVKGLHRNALRDRPERQPDLEEAPREHDLPQYPAGRGRERQRLRRRQPHDLRVRPLRRPAVDLRGERSILRRPDPRQWPALRRLEPRSRVRDRRLLLIDSLPGAPWRRRTGATPWRLRGPAVNRAKTGWTS